VIDFSVSKVAFLLNESGIAKKAIRSTNAFEKKKFTEVI
jgi:hypothetical protein